RIQAIAAHTGMSGVFKLIGADVYEVLSIEPALGEFSPLPEGVANEELWTPAPDIPFAQRSEIWALQRVSGRVNRARTLDELFSVVLRTLSEDLGFTHVRLLAPDSDERWLVVRASHGFGGSVLGKKIAVGEGLIGIVAKEMRPLRLTRVAGELRYGRAARAGLEREPGGLPLAPELPLPGLPDAQSHLVLPLVAQDRLTGVLAVESPNPLAFEAWHEAFLDVLGNQMAGALDRLLQDEEDHPAKAAGRGEAPWPEVCPERLRRFVLYRNDDCIFLDGEYLIRNVPGRILWKLLTQYRDEGRREFTNRELRLDPCLGLPEVRDNLESRLILLRRRLEQRCPDVRLVPVARGRFGMQVSCKLDLVERASA
ncbi:MAG TPA: GAF domain-containing protein, partial [Myxococcaceae bacterium]|nr:GAF domain-containing protein [Myxococcaceae bacterium]